MNGHVNTIPREVVEAAMLDRGGHARILLTVILVLVASVVALVEVSGELVIAFVGLSDTDVQTAVVGLYGTMSFRDVNWGVLAAEAVLTALPVRVRFLSAQEHIVSGLLAGSGKEILKHRKQYVPRAHTEREWNGLARSADSGASRAPHQCRARVGCA
jgi:ABC-type maltose transport system permease subunit